MLQVWREEEKMLIHKLTIQDFGVYGGLNEFNFITSPERTVILCGGRNGAGKTTLFESIMLCLYGMDFDEQFSKKEYQRKILRSFHKNPIEQNTSKIASISIEFEISYEGEIQIYKITRMWENREGNLDEKLDIHRLGSKSEEFERLEANIQYDESKKQKELNSERLDAVDESYWQSFIEQLIPRGIVKLFFFDGEKIQSIAEQSDQKEYIEKSFNTLLGLDVVNKLKKDIETTISKNVTKGKETFLKSEKLKKIREEKLRKSYKKTLTELDAKLRFYNIELSKDEFLSDDLEKMLDLKENLNEKISELDVQIRTNKEQVEKLELESKNQEEIFRNIGGEYHEKTREINLQNSKLDTIIIETKHDMLELISKELPFSLIPNQLNEIKNQINQDQRIIKSRYEKKIIDKNCEKISNLLNSEKFMPEISSEVRKTIEKRLLEELNQYQNNGSNETFFDYSEAKMDAILQMIERSARDNITKINKLTETYRTCKNELEKNQIISNVETDDKKIREVVSKIKNIASNIKEIKMKIDELEFSFYNYSGSQLMLLNSKIRTCLELKNSEDLQNSGKNMAPKVLDILEIYSEVLKQEKLIVLEREFKKSLEVLLHKEDFIDKVTITNDFDIKLIDKNKNEITKSMLSKGELQIFATALVYALAKSSGRPLPFMIDTPLARLDLEHRENIVESFFPKTSHQTIILSTNSEITKEYFEKLRPSIAKSYLIEFNDKEGKTSISNGYFFDVEAN